MADITIESLQAQIADLTASGTVKDTDIAALKTAADAKDKQIADLTAALEALKLSKGFTPSAKMVTVVKDGAELDINESTLGNYKALGYKVKE